MIPELEAAIRAIVRDELKTLLGAISAPARVKPPTDRQVSGRMQRIVLAVLEGGAKLTTAQIAERTYVSGTDLGTHRNSIRNTVWTMHEKGRILRDKTTEEWTYYLPESTRVSDRTESPEPASGEDLEGERGPRNEGDAQTL